MGSWEADGDFAPLRIPPTCSRKWTWASNRDLRTLGTSLLPQLAVDSSTPAQMVEEDIWWYIARCTGRDVSGLQGQLRLGDNIRLPNWARMTRARTNLRKLDWDVPVSSKGIVPLKGTYNWNDTLRRGKRVQGTGRRTFFLHERICGRSRKLVAEDPGPVRKAVFPQKVAGSRLNFACK